MIQVTIRKNHLSLLGHANYAEEGKDIVCAAVSTLTYNFIDAINRLTEDDIEFKMSPGDVDIDYKDLTARGQLLLDSFFIGLETVADAYPDHVRLYK